MSSDSRVPDMSGPSIAKLALALIKIPSPSADEGEVARVARDEMARLGFDVEVDDLGNVVGTIGSGDGPCVLIDAHMDTVGVTQPELWSHDPYGQVDEGRLYGRGAMDMKGPLAAVIRGVASLAPNLRWGRVVVSASIAEEMVEGTALLQVAERVNPNFVVIAEATSLRVARGQRGRAEVVIEIQGRPTHSSRPELGINAADVMADVVVALRAIESPHHDVLGDGILVLTDVMSHPYPGLSVVPDRCLATFDRRTLPGETEKMVLAPIIEIVSRVARERGAAATVGIAEDDFASYTGAKVTAPNFASAWFFDEAEPIVAISREALNAVGINTRLGHYAFCTNGSATAGRLGIPTIGFGPGDEERAHRVDEYVEIDDLEQAARGYAAIARALIERGV